MIIIFLIRINSIASHFAMHHKTHLNVGILFSKVTGRFDLSQVIRCFILPYLLCNLFFMLFFFSLNFLSFVSNSMYTLVEGIPLMTQGLIFCGRIVMLSYDGSHISFVDDLIHWFFQYVSDFLYERTENECERCMRNCYLWWSSIITWKLVFNCSSV